MKAQLEDLHCQLARRRLFPSYDGRGQPLSLTLSFGEISWFDVQGEIQRCDWFKRTHSLNIYIGHKNKKTFFDQSQSFIYPYA
jgi:hypothetical protein